MAKAAPPITIAPKPASMFTIPAIQPRCFTGVGPSAGPCFRLPGTIPGGSHPPDRHLIDSNTHTRFVIPESLCLVTPFVNDNEGLRVVQGF
jgi:hypothetical protein